MATALANSIAQGRTGVLLNTPAYGVLCAGTTTTNPIQDAGTGTSGQVPVSNGAGSLFTWTTNSSIGGFRLISTTNPSASATVDLTGLSTTYSVYKIIVNRWLATAALSNMVLRCSTNNGASYDAGANYNWAYTSTKLDTVPGLAAVGATASTGIQLFQGTSATAGQTTNVEITLRSPATDTFVIDFIMTAFLSGDGWYTVTGGGVYTGAASVNAVRLLQSANTIASGSVKLYGIPA